MYVLHYRRAPEHAFPAAVDDARAAYDELAAHGPTAVFGDSAGGCLALLLALRLRDAGTAAAGAGPGLAGHRPDARPQRAPTRASTPSSGGTGCGPAPGRSSARADAAALSPLSAPLAGLPPVRIQVAARERLRAEGEELAVRLRKAGVDADIEVLPRVWHDVHLLAHLVPEGAAAVGRLGRWLGERLTGATDGDGLAS